MRRWMLLWALLVAVVPQASATGARPHPAAGAIQAADVRLRAIEADRELSGRERSGRLEAAYAEVHPWLQDGLEELDSGDLARAFDAAHRAAFYTSTLPALRDMQALLAELERREEASDREREKMFGTLVDYREFDLARAMAEQHRGMEVEALPQVYVRAPSEAGGVTVYRTDPERFALHAERIRFDRGTRIVMVTHPLCAFSNAAMEAIAGDPRLSAALASDVIWLAPAAPRLDFEVLQAWNRDHPSMQIVLAHARADWPMLEDGWVTPEFLLLRDGEVVDGISGWPRDGSHRARLAELLVRAGRLED